MTQRRMAQQPCLRLNHHDDTKDTKSQMVG